MLEFVEVVRRRRSIRKYKSNPVPEEKIKFILEAARLAPSWANKQCWKYIIVTDESLKRKIAKQDWVAQAPLIIVGCANPAESGIKHGQKYYMLDMGISMEHLILAATDQDLGTCWIAGQFDEKTIKKVLGIPKNIRVVALTPVGYPDEEPPRRARKTVYEIASKNHW